MKRRTGWTMLIVANVVCYCVLSFYQTGVAAPRAGGVPPFANAVEQRIEMINQLKQVNQLLKEQNALLRGGQLKVVVAEPPKGP